MQMILFRRTALVVSTVLTAAAALIAGPDALTVLAEGFGWSAGDAGHPEMWA
ncbi:hypothetical protein [Micromonospora cathayae]|uniref:Uncharacterized protein n=1 Tax=Micromonospora cathayae TaxID=3028804 RepID=A0ABY7ZRA3_9ACTN|nr:hypothetical protein [Micromonospora sp. HUAS 3]WDZ85552.1 hypothetical protein PVK37_03595 [Micromonospora sp. HUAS 3]